MFYEWKLNITPLLCNRLDSFRRPCGWVSSDTLAVSPKAAPDTIFPIIQWRCRLQSNRSLAFMSCKLAASMKLASTNEPLYCAAPVPVYACLSLCVDIVFWFYFCNSFLHIIHIYICICIYLDISLYSLYICTLYMPLHVYYFLYLSRMFLAHVLRPTSFHRCSSLTSHCRSFTSLPRKRFRRPPGPQVVNLSSFLSFSYLFVWVLEELIDIWLWCCNFIIICLYQHFSFSP